MSKLEEYKENLVQAETLLLECESEVEHYKALKQAARPNATGRIANSDREARLRVAQYDCAMKMAQTKVSLCKNQIKALKAAIKNEEKAGKVAMKASPAKKTDKKAAAKTASKGTSKTTVKPKASRKTTSKSIAKSESNTSVKASPTRKTTTKTRAKAGSSTQAASSSSRRATAKRASASKRKI